VTSPSPPEVAIKHLKDWRAYTLRALPPNLAARYREAFPKDIEVMISSATGAWLPVIASTKMAEHLALTAGPARAHEIYAQWFSEVLRSPLFAPAVRTGIRLLGLQPGTFARWAHVGWSSIYRHCGVVEGTSPRPKVACIHYRELPKEVRRATAWLDAIPSSVEGILRLCEVRGVVRFDRRRIDEGLALVEMEWS
jgi:hypothetical protein